MNSCSGHFSSIPLRSLIYLFLATKWKNYDLMLFFKKKTNPSMNYRFIFGVCSSLKLYFYRFNFSYAWYAAIIYACNRATGKFILHIIFNALKNNESTIGQRKYKIAIDSRTDGISIRAAAPLSDREKNCLSSTEWVQCLKWTSNFTGVANEIQKLNFSFGRK